MSSVDLRGVSKHFGATTVLQQLDLHIDDGEFVALLGPSGCGKTTTLRLIAGLETPNGGEISLGTQRVYDANTWVPPEQRNIGMVFQSYAVWPHLSVERNVAYPLELRGVAQSERQQRVADALNQVKLSTFAQRMPHQLSGGQLQRVALARALVMRPRTLLLDEPLSALDLALREELRAELAALRRVNRQTTIMVTHDQSEALALADRIAVMNRGRIEQLDTPTAVYQSPATPFVASFVGGAMLFDGVAKGSNFALDEGGPTLTLGTPLAREGAGTIAVRAEHVHVVKAADGAGEVLARLFLGSSVELRIRLTETHMVKASAPVTADVRVGDRVNVVVQEAHFYSRAARPAA